VEAVGREQDEGKDQIPLPFLPLSMRRRMERKDTNTHSTQNNSG
jgi:hypothetical protein